MLTAHTSPLPPNTWGPGSVNQHSSHVDGQTGQRSQFTCPVYIATYHPIKPVYSEQLSVTVPVVIGTCTVLVGMVESVPVPPHFHKFATCLFPKYQRVATCQFPKYWWVATRRFPKTGESWLASTLGPASRFTVCVN